MHSDKKNDTLPALPGKPKEWFPLWATLIVAAVWLMAIDLEINLQTLIWGMQDMGEFISRFTSPDFSRWKQYLSLMGATLAMAFWGSAIAFIISFVLAPLGARNLSPHPVIFRLVREFFNFCRAMPDLLLALILVSAIGLGPLPGILALGISTSGFLGKFFAESLERVPAGRYEALASVGAGYLQTLMYAGWPSVLREMTGYTLFILDRNVRMASVLGLVGAGGIGTALSTALRTFNYDRAAAMIIVLLVTILLIDYLSAWLRRRLN
ncbi:phosphonate ABC transporter, permease protein PhnE [Alkalimonas sp. MEB108]|uniref:Phosphonate ABC transporter, permease protein PhnE n=1 Tax=Alkalimonas cellulosilytica TaxID=3058395 RepID=A0ABU7J6F1_9GAMM|nr:phosphonate ABC transporter, permease protein PhnE [Alkalimonas sp. MEB108]MEE2002099.1 phosphonate ABC transporter, permease protein PhnE [Alkalimonas sp. MEB108]